MEKQQMIDMFLMGNAKNFPDMSQKMVREKLESLNESQLSSIGAVQFKDPTMMLIISIVGGTLGVDRFMVGDIGMGVLKLLTGGLCGILTIIDWFSISKITKQKNLEILFNIY